MNKRIQTYNDFQKEQERLEKILQFQKEVIINDLDELKEEIMPIVNTISGLGKMLTRNNQNILVSGSLNWVIDVLFKKLILSRSGWLTRRIVPFFIKNFSSHFVAEHKEALMTKLFSWIGRKNSNGQAVSDPS